MLMDMALQGHTVMVFPYPWSDIMIVCPSQAVNITLVAISFLIILGVMIFMVIQGKTPKNKEAVSSKILLNHIQMLALLSGNAPFTSFLSL